MQNIQAEPFPEPAIWVPRLQRILMEQASLYARLDTLSRQQSELIHVGNTDALLSVLGQRQEIIDRLTALAQEFAPFREQWQVLMGTIDAAISDNFEQSLSSLAAIMDAIAQRDDHDRVVLEQRRSALSNDVLSVQSGHGALAAYQSNAQQSHIPRYQDRNG